MARYINKYATQTDYTKETDARNALGETVSLIKELDSVRYDKGNVGPGPGPSPDPYNPLNLPAYTIRIKFTDEYDPHDRWPNSNWFELTQVSTSPNVWNIKKLQDQTDWSSMVGSDQGVNNHILEILGANSTGVTDMSEMFYQLESLSSVAIFDTSSVENMNSMFAGCNSITTIPLFDTSSVTVMASMFNDCDSLATVPLLNTSNVQDMAEMFNYCTRVQSGALALYQQASRQTTPPSYHYNTFYGCGSDTQTGLAELSQIPEDWGGTAG